MHPRWRGSHVRPALVALWLLGCRPDPVGSDAPGSHGPLLRAAGHDLAVVAEVGGVPIHEDCVRRQAQGIDARAALEQCIDFELLAQAAQARGLGRDPEVLAAGKVEAVRRLLDAEVVAPYPSADHLGQLLHDTYRALEKRIHVPEIRHVAHVLAEVPRDEPPGTAADRRARALADELHAALAHRRDLSLDDLYRVAQEVAGDRRIGPRDKRTDEPMREHFKLVPRHPNIHEAFTGAAFAIAAPGTVSPPTRTHVGWHVILLTGLTPAQNSSPDQARELILAHLRRERYQAVLAPLQARASVEVDPDALARVQAADEASRLPLGELR